jgi:hypothetical protein
MTIPLSKKNAGSKIGISTSFREFIEIFVHEVWLTADNSTDSKKIDLLTPYI